MILKDRIAIITGSSIGFGKEVAKKFIAEGSTVVMCARNYKKLHEAFLELNKNLSEGQKVLPIKCDVSKTKDIKSLVNRTLSEFNRVDILVNNAGIYGPKGLIEDVDWNEWKKAIEINLYGVISMCREIIPYMKQNKYGKIINLSGGGATAPMPRISAYAASKAAVVRFTETIAEECKEFNIDINAIAPGPLNTRLLEEILSAGPTNVGKVFFDKSLKQKESGGAPLEIGAELCVYLASSESDGITGKLISAIWDNWKNFKSFKSELMCSDIYTLRRITEKDRGKNW